MTIVSWRMNLRLYFKLQFMQLRSTVEYAADFWIGIVGAVLMQATGLVFISALFSQIPQVASWTVWNIVLLYGLAMLPKGLTKLFCDGPWTLRSKVNTGDRVLVRPISSDLQSASAIVSIHGLGQAVLGGVLIVLGLTRSDATFYWWTPLFLVLAIGSGAMMMRSPSITTVDVRAKYCQLAGITK